MKILILGASGYAGSCIKAVLSKRFENVSGTYHTFNETYLNDRSTILFDAENPEGLHDILSNIKPEIVISCLTGDFEKLIAVHKVAADYLQESSGKLIFLSSSNVFDGALDRPHYESDTPKAESDYGKFKIRCEEIIEKTLGKNGIILRLPQIYGKNCPRVLELQQSVKTRQPIRTLKNIYVNYTTNQQIAEWILFILEHGLTGIFHIGTKDIGDYTAFQKELLQRFHLEQQPKFEVIEFPEKLVQAVLSSRNEIPKELQLSIQDVLINSAGSF